MPLQRTISPIDNSVYVERELASGRAIDEALDRARHAQREWRRVPVETRAQILGRFCDAFEQRREAVAQELAWQMGRPVRYGPNEVRGTLERARHMIAIAPQALVPRKVTAFEAPVDCATPRRVLVRIRATLRGSATLKSYRGFLRTTSPARTAEIAVSTPSGKPLAYAQVFESGNARLFAAKGCVED